MIQFPLVWIVTVLTSIAAVTLIQNAQIPMRARLLLCTFLGSLGLLALIIGLRLAEWTDLAFSLQPVIAVMIAPSAYLGFLAFAKDGGAAWQKLLLRHGLPIFAIQIVMIVFPVPIDGLILAVNVTYLIKLSLLFRKKDDDFAHSSPNTISTLRAAMIATLILLIFMITTDLVIVAALMTGGNGPMMQFISGASGFLTVFAMIAALIGTPMVMRSSQILPDEPSQSPQPSQEDHALLAEIDLILTDRQLYKDPAMTLARLARRMGQPSRDISSVINRCTGDNFSRYINGFRINHAKQSLRETDLPVTEVMLEAGFVSKSSFNTEFKRITGLTPSAFRAKEAKT